jgi:hypothetical protein
MSNPRGCRCQNTENWVVVHFHRARIANPNPRARERWTESRYSTVRCRQCRVWWRTDAKYVERLPRED